MKLTLNFFLVTLLVVLCLVLLCVDDAEARRKKKIKECIYRRKGEEGPCDTTTGMKPIAIYWKWGDPSCRRRKYVFRPCSDMSMTEVKACKYQRKGEEGPCDPTTNMKQITINLKKGDHSCADPTYVTKPCSDMSMSIMKKVKGCKYEKKGAEWTECDEVAGQKTKVMNLKPGSPAECPPTRTKTKVCGSKKKAGRKNRKGCVYNKQPWSECSMDTKTKQREMILDQGDPILCLPKKIVTKKCKSACRYKNGDWSPCNPSTGLKHRTLTPIKGGATECESTVQSKRCHTTAELKGAKSDKCQYSLSNWSQCDPRSNTMTQWMTLKSGDPNVCIRSKKLSKKCTIACKFRRGEWSQCDEKTQLTTRVDSLIKGSPQQCDLTREITRKCKRACKYSYGDWGECDPVTNHRTRVKKLIESSGSDKCHPEEIITKPCNKKDGEERCFLGAWGDFGPCTNGVMTKHRPVLQGGVECERKAVITKACDIKS